MLRGGRLSPNVPGELRTGEALEGPKSSVCPWCFTVSNHSGKPATSDNAAAWSRWEEDLTGPRA